MYLYLPTYGSVSFVLMQEGSSDRSQVFSATRWLTCPVVGLGLLEGRAWPSVRDGLGPVRGFSSKPAGTIGELCASRALTFNEPERPGQNFGPDFSCHFAAEGAQKKLAARPVRCPYWSSQLFFRSAGDARRNSCFQKVWFCVDETAVCKIQIL